MVNWMELVRSREFVAAFVLLLLLVSAIGLSACTSAGGPGQEGFGEGPGNRGGGPGFSGNLTEEERRQLMQETMQAGIAACGGKAEGDSCAVRGLGGNATGTCRALNGTLSCGFGAGSRQGGTLPPPQ